MVKYSEVRNKLQTGDVVLFSGKGGISTAIKHFTRSKWSHVGMIYRANGGPIFLAESTTLTTLADYEYGTPRKGVQLVLFSERLRTYEGDHIAVRCLQGFTRSEEAVREFEAYRMAMRGKPYEQDKLELIRSAYDYGPFADNKEDLSSLFCSEYVAEAWKWWGILPADRPSNEYTPADFAPKTDEGTGEVDVLLTQEVFLSDVMYVANGGTTFD